MCNRSAPVQLRPARRDLTGGAAHRLLRVMQISKRLSYVLVFTVCCGAIVIDRAFLAPRQVAAGDGAEFVVLPSDPVPLATGTDRRDR